LLPHANVRLIPPKGYLTATPAALTVTFYGGAPDVTRHLRFASPYFRTAEIEWDTVEGATRVTHINTGDHPNRPATLHVGPLTMIDVFSRVGVDLQRSPNESIVPLSLSDEEETAAGTPLSERWSDFELNEAMVAYWSRYQARSQWAMWLLFAGLHECPDVRGIMFDHEGTFKRQGGAVFNDWWLTDPETIGFELPDAHIHRRRFVTACHETGHCFNLIHSADPYSPAWWRLGGEPFALSFMNNPEDSRGTRNFFAEFEYSFSKEELQFIRHAPANFVEMGGPRYGDKLNEEPTHKMARAWGLQVSVRRNNRVFDFLEPVIIDVSLTNQSDRPQVVDENLLGDGQNLSIFISRERRLLTRVKPYVIASLGPKWRVLQRGESICRSVFASAGVMGWHISEPGPYEIRVELGAAIAQAVSDHLLIRVASARERDEEVIAQDFFTDEVGRALVLAGAAEGSKAHAILEEVADRMGDRPVSRHAQISLGMPKTKVCRVMRVPDSVRPMSSVAADGGGFGLVPAKPDDARHLLAAALRGGDGADTLGTGRLARMTEWYTGWLHREGGDRPGRKVRPRAK
jgi:hypothetical protein